MKTVMEIDWSKAPEGATHHVKDLDDGSMTEFVKYSKTGKVGEAYYSMGGDDGRWSIHVENDNDFILTVKPEAQPVYTQAMADNEELPPIGSRAVANVTPSMNSFFARFAGVEVEIIAHDKNSENKDCAAFKYKDSEGHYEYHALIADCFKPIDTRTDKEKAIAKAISNLMFFGDQTQAEQKANETLIAIMEGKVAGVKWVGE